MNSYPVTPGGIWFVICDITYSHIYFKLVRVDLDAHHLSNIKYQTEFARGSTMASVTARCNGTSAISIKQVIAIRK